VHVGEELPPPHGTDRMWDERLAQRLRRELETELEVEAARGDQE
jgi:hypothetical protein